MEIEKFRDLLAQAKLYTPLEREQSVFAIAGRGYFENPTTDLLAFFFDPDNAHGLGDCFLKAFLSCLPDTEGLDTSLRKAPQREVTTLQGNRIDLVLRGKGWNLVLENKIFHGQVNPFEDYEQYAEEKLSINGSRILYVVLSPSGKSVRASWHGVSYRRFIMAAQLQLAQLVTTPSFDKWQVFAREFLLHLENITVEQTMHNDVASFVFENFTQINKLAKLKERVISALDGKILARLVADVPGYQRAARRHNWENGPALRYYCSTWNTKSDVVLYLNGGVKTLTPSIRVYLFNMTMELEEQAKSVFSDGMCDIWHENNKSILAFQWKVDGYDEEKILSGMSKYMLLLMGFEREIRPGLALNPI